MQSEVDALVMPDSAVVMIVTDEGDDGLTLESPQVPGFYYVRPNLIEFRTDMRQALVDIGVDPGRVIFYQQQPFQTPEGAEYLLRFRDDEHRDQRIALAARVRATLAGDQGKEALAEIPPTATGERVFVCAMEDDLVGSLLAALGLNEGSTVGELTAAIGVTDNRLVAV